MLSFIAAAVLLPQDAGVAQPQGQTPPQTAASAARKVAVLPWCLKDGTDTAVETARDTVHKIFESVNYEVIPEVRTKSVWEEDLGYPALKLSVGGGEAYPDLPPAKQLLEIGKKMGVDLVCAGRAKWHTKSVWVSLGPKTKADCTVDVIIVDVAKEEVVLDAKDVKSDSTKKEHALESFGTLFISGGFTMVSGGPKTPHQKRAALNAIAKATEPWVQTAAQSRRKIG
ncbi:MAG: hypothetical protein QOJ65_1564 [Fimbriimonadaceae bacterium]|jgi:hypothetical protein|nr:hypothetical protein [Fimbriimonadaceae bacterium]